MECLHKPIWNKLKKEELQDICITKPDRTVYEKALQNWDAVAKPIDGMGYFEAMTAQIGAILGTDQLTTLKKAVIIMCADNGIVEEGVSQSGQEVTAAVARSMGRRQSSVGKMADHIQADTIPVDIGIHCQEKIFGVLDKKIRCGTRNFNKEPAMTEEEVMRALAVGIELAGWAKEQKYQILATGEMGIGNTTTSSAVTAALLRCDVNTVTGKGAGLTKERLQHKRQIIQDAITKYDLYHADAFKILQTVGGLDLAGLAGVCIGGAVYHLPIVLDGVISMAAALAAERLCPGVKRYLIASHKGKEPAISLLQQELELSPVIEGNMAVGEGVGAVMLFSLIDMALCIYGEKTTFSDIQIEQYTRY